MEPKQSEILMYQTEDGVTKIDVQINQETVWLTQSQMMELFQTSKQNISLHISNVFKESKVDAKGAVAKATEGSRVVHTAEADGKTGIRRKKRSRRQIWRRQALLRAGSCDDTLARHQ